MSHSYTRGGFGRWSGGRLDRSVSEALTAAFAIAGKPAPKLRVGQDPNNSQTWSYDSDRGVFYVPLLPSASMDEDQEHLFRAAIAHEIAGKESSVSREAENLGRIKDLAAKGKLPGVKEGKRPATVAFEQMRSLARGLSSGLVNAEVIKKWPGMERSLRLATETMLESAVVRTGKMRRKTKMARTKDAKNAALLDAQLSYSDLSLLATYAASGGDIGKLVDRMNFLDDLPEEFMHAATQLAEAAKVVGLPRTNSEVVKVAAEWLKYFDTPEEPPSDGQGEGEEGEGEGEGEGQGGGEGQGEGDADGEVEGEAGPEGAQASARAYNRQSTQINQYSTKKDGELTPNPYDAARTAGDNSHQRATGFAQQAGEALDESKKQGVQGGYDYATYQGDPKEIDWEKGGQKQLKEQSGVCSHEITSWKMQAQHYLTTRPDVAAQRAHLAQLLEGYFDLHYDRDVGVIGQALRQALRGPTISRQARHQVGRFNPRNAARYLAGNRDVFDRVQYLPGDKVAVSILVDASGSMAGCDPVGGSGDLSVPRAVAAHRAACVLTDALMRMGVTPRYSAYTTSNSGSAANIYNICNPKVSKLEFRKRRTVMADLIVAVGGTPTLPALVYELELLKKRDESQRFMFLITDGEASDQAGQVASIATAKERGITTIILATGGSSDNWKGFVEAFDGAAIVLHVPPDHIGPTMARELVKQLMLQRVLAGRR